MKQKSLTLIARSIRSFCVNRSGQMSVIVALCSFPLAVSSGITFDYTKATYARTQLVLGLSEAAFVQFEDNRDHPAQWHGAIKEHLETNYSSSVIGSLSGLSLKREGETLKISAQSQIGTSLLGFVGINTLNIDADVQLTIPAPKSDLLVNAAA